MERITDGVILNVASDCFAKGVYLDFADIDCVLSENFFDLTDAGEREIYIQTGYSPEELAGKLQIRSVYDIGVIE